MSRPIRRLAIVLCFLLLLSAVESAARIWMMSGTRITRDQFLADHPAAYAESPYYSPAFFVEQNALDDVTITGEAINHITRDVRGRWINTDDGNRRTTGQPERWSHTLWVFGLSTIFSPDVPDEYTIPSRLQSRLPQYRVVNRGMWGGSMALLLVRVKETPIATGDSVILYGGANEVIAVQAAAERLRPGWCATMYTTAALCRLLTVYDGETEARQLLKSVRQIEEYARGHSAGFLFVLQPHIYSQRLSAYEQYLTTVTAIMPQDIDRAFAAAWPAFQGVTRQVGGVDLTHVLDDLRQRHEVYLDFIHVTERANEVIARDLFDQISIF